MSSSLTGRIFGSDHGESSRQTEFAYKCTLVYNLQCWGCQMILEDLFRYFRKAGIVAHKRFMVCHEFAFYCAYLRITMSKPVAESGIVPDTWSVSPIRHSKVAGNCASTLCLPGTTTSRPAIVSVNSRLLKL